MITGHFFRRSRSCVLVRIAWLFNRSGASIASKRCLSRFRVLVRRSPCRCVILSCAHYYAQPTFTLRYSISGNCVRILCLMHAKPFMITHASYPNRSCLYFVLLFPRFSLDVCYLLYITAGAFLNAYWFVIIVKMALGPVKKTDKSTTKIH